MTFATINDNTDANARPTKSSYAIDKLIEFDEIIIDTKDFKKLPHKINKRCNETMYICLIVVLTAYYFFNIYQFYLAYHIPTEDHLCQYSRNNTVNIRNMIFGISSFNMIVLVIPYYYIFMDMQNKKVHEQIDALSFTLIVSNVIIGSFFYFGTFLQTNYDNYCDTHINFIIMMQLIIYTIETFYALLILIYCINNIMKN